MTQNSLATELPRDDGTRAAVERSIANAKTQKGTWEKVAQGSKAAYWESATSKQRTRNTPRGRCR